jgi:hypothetical protein
MSAEVQEKWLKWVALSTTILAVCAAFASLKGGGYSTQVQLMTTKESDQWSYYEAKSIKLHLTEMEHDLFTLELIKAQGTLLQETVSKKIKNLESDIDKYTKEKDEIKNVADGIEDRQAILKRHGGNFGLAVMFFQIAIMLSAIGSLLKQRPAWICGMLIGLAGMVYFINGFYLFF